MQRTFSLIHVYRCNVLSCAAVETWTATRKRASKDCYWAFVFGKDDACHVATVCTRGRPGLCYTLQVIETLVMIMTDLELYL